MDQQIVDEDPRILIASDQRLAQHLRWESYLSQRRRLLYVSTPKVACTSLKWWFAALEGHSQALRSIVDSGQSDTDLVVHETYKVAPHVTGLDFEHLAEALTSATYFRFAVVRNPFTRVFSAWQSKLLVREPLQIGPYINTEFFHHPIQRGSDIVAAFESFLEHLASNEAPSFWDHHWTPQVALLRPDLIEYSKLAKIEKPAELSKALREWLGGDAPDPFLLRRTNESIIPYLPEFISERSTRLIRALYAEDFDTFGYDSELPSASETFSAEQLNVAIKAVKLIRGRHEQLENRAARIQILIRTTAEDKSEIADLGRTVADRDEELSSLNMLVSERGAYIANLEGAAAEYDEKLASLSRDLERRDEEVSRLNAFVSERDACIANSSKAAADHDGQAASLGKAIALRDEEVATLTALLSERDACIANLAKAAAEHDDQVASLSRAIARKEEELGSLTQVVSERDARILGMQKAAVDYDEQAANLARVRDDEVARSVSDRDGQIIRLSQIAAEGEKQTHTLVHEKNREIQALRLELAQIVRSRSWRATAPLRKLVAPCWRALSIGKKVSDILKVRFDLNLISATRRIRASSLFDSKYYLATYPDVRAARLDPATHYLLYGWKENRNPSAAFNTATYLSTHPDVAAAGRNPLIHYLRHGQKEGRCLGGAIQTGEDPDFESTPLHLLSNDGSEDEAISDVQELTPETAVDGEVHAIRSSGLFDETFYLAMYQDLRPAPLDLVRHYCEHGWREGRNPSDDFNTRFYLETYGDIRNAGMNPFWHYVVWGASESRDAIPDMSPRYEDDVRFGPIETDIKLLAFYASPDWSKLRSGRPRFTGHLQPKVPNEELGYYDPLDWRVLKRQALMAKLHGVHAFCFDLNVATSKALRLQPIGHFLAHDEIDIHFCSQIAISCECLLEPAAKSLARIFADRRHVRVEDRPVLLVKVAKGWLGASTYLTQLCQLLAERGGAIPYLIVRSTEDEGSTPLDFGDAVLDLPSVPVSDQADQVYPLEKNGIGAVPYSVVASNGVAQTEILMNSERPHYHAVSLGRDNTAQNSLRPLVFTRFHIRDYRRWFDAAIAATRKGHRDDRRFVFLNAWNDWNEGLYLEPDIKGGFGRLNETTRALLNMESGLRMPKVSVIVPNYNHEPYLRRRLESIFGQSYQNFEVILLDDCSSDSSTSVLDEYAASYPDITRTIYNDKNSGSAFRQWAKGIKQATGELVWIAESDDFCDKHFLELLVPSFDDEAVLLAYGNTVFVDGDETPLDQNDDFEAHVKDLNCGNKWASPYVATAHHEVINALGIKNTIPNASGVVFKRPIDMPLLDDESWLSMRVAGDWVFYLHILRGGKIAYRPEAFNFFRRYNGSAAELTYKQDVFYKEVGVASRAVAALYDVSEEVLERCRNNCRKAYSWHVPNGNDDEFDRWYDYETIVKARNKRSLNIMISTMGFYPGGAEILPIRMANELKRQGHSVLFFSCGLTVRQDGVRRMLRNDVPMIETPNVAEVKDLISEFGVEALNTHQWHMQKYPLRVPDVFDGLRAHVASLHGMIEHGDAFEASEEQLRGADGKVTTWVYTAEKNLGPFFKYGLCDKSSGRFVKLPNGIQTPDVAPIPRARMNIPDDAFVLCCVSRAIPDKGWAETIEAVATARVISGRDIRLILVGNGPVYDEYCRVGAPDFVYLAGFSNNSVGHYASADMGIMLTKFKSESFPLTIVDCLFAGRPYIASAIGDIRNMLSVDNDVAGSIIELDNWEIPVETAAQEIAAFASDPRRYLNASSLVDAAASRCRIDAVVSQYVSLFEAERNSPTLGERNPHNC